MTHKIFSVQQKVRFQHTDPAGIVFFPRFVEMMNATNEDFWEHLGFPFSSLHKRGAAPIVNISVDFKKPVFLGEILTKYLEITHIGRSSHTLHYWFERDGERVLDASQTSVFVTLQADESFVSAPIPDDIRRAMQAYLKV